MANSFPKSICSSESKVHPVRYSCPHLLKSKVNHCYGAGKQKKATRPYKMVHSKDAVLSWVAGKILLWLISLQLGVPVEKQVLLGDLAVGRVVLNSLTGYSSIV